MAMTDLLEANVSTSCGYRLHRLEVFNWGTFDSATQARRGRVYKVEPAGQTTLLIGKNGSGKSTLVDALLTLLVRPAVRNYNVAAGAKKRERDERTYIKGAYDRRSREADNRSDVQFLRPDGKHYSVLLACFRNEQTDQAFTVAQVLYLTAEGRAEKVYCFAAAERSIAADCSGIRKMEKLPQQMRQRGFRTTKSYAEYHHWFRKATGVQPKAMDMLNQTVAVKDIQRLNDFVRDHMLEAKPWGEKVDSLLKHFTQLSEAHRSLVRVRDQLRLLEPIAERGAAYRQEAQRLESTQRLMEAADSFFRQKTIDVLTPECECMSAKLEGIRQQQQRRADEVAQLQDECRRLTNQIEQAGGDRLREIPRLIDTEEARAAAKRRENRQFHDALSAAGLFQHIPQRRISDQQAFADVQGRLPALQRDVENRVSKANRARDGRVIRRGEQTRLLRETQEELQALQNRRENLPQAFAEVRRQLCEELRIPVLDLPFAAELISVLPEENEWEASLEMVLRPLALSLLVPERFYRVVSNYVDRTRLQDHLGRGQRLVYLKVGRRNPPAGPVPHPQSLIRKLALRRGHPLLPWVKAELEERNDYRCCDTMEEFQKSHGRAITRQRHVKSGSVQHTKDDRDRVVNPRHFVLGWDNREKCRRLAEEADALRDEVLRLDQRIQRLDAFLEELRMREAGIRQALRVADFASIDFMSHDLEIAALKLEKQKLEEGNQKIQTLKARRSQVDSQVEALSLERDELLKQEGELEKSIQDGKRLIANARRTMGEREGDGSLARHAESFQVLEEHFVQQPLIAADLIQRESAFKESRRVELERLRAALEPLRADLLKAMNRFLRDFPEQQHDLDADVPYLDGFLGLLDQIRQEGLPHHEQRFKQSLNDKVTREIGLLNGELQRERAEIEDKIELLNQALRQLEYRSGTHMRLEARLVRDREITEFRDALAECLAGTFEGTLEADEARFLQIEKLITRLRDEERWRNKVTDVRRWFDFAAREIEDATGEERSYYEDSTGQSGGEKAKLAFTILVAAIAYQYDLDPSRATSDRFQFVVVDEMFSKVDDQYAEYALELFQKFGLQLLIVAPLDAKARVTEPYVGCYLLVSKDHDCRSEIHSMTAREFQEQIESDSYVSGSELPR